MSPGHLLATPGAADQERPLGTLKATAQGWKWKAALSRWGHQEQGRRGWPPAQAGVSRASGLRAKEVGRENWVRRGQGSLRGEGDCGEVGAGRRVWP